MSYYSEATTEIFNTIMGAAQGISGILSSVKREKNTSGYLARSSIMKAAKDLVMSFPVLCADTISPETANMIVKAIERNCVTTLQLLFSAANLKGEDGIQVLQMWHKNIDNDRNMDDYLDAVDAISLGLGESGVELLEALADKFGNEMVQEFASACRFTYRENSLNENSLMQYTVREGYGGYNVYSRTDPRSLTVYNESVETIDEARTVNNNFFNQVDFIPDPDGYVRIPDNLLSDPAFSGIGFTGHDKHSYADKSDFDATIDAKKLANDKKFKDAQIDKWQADYNHQKRMDDRNYDFDRKKFKYQKGQDQIKNGREKRKLDAAEKQQKLDNEYRDQRDKVKDAYDKDKLDLDRDKYYLDKDKFTHQQYQDALRNADQEVEFFHKQLLPSDVKKANEMVPSMMIIRFNAIDPDNMDHYTQPNYQQFIAGVKARLIAVSSMEVINAIRSTEKSKVNLTNLVRATTKEISFCRDFIAGIDQAKIDAKNNSKLSKNSPIWRSLQWRSSKSVMNRLRKRKPNDAGAITTLVLTSEEVNFMKSEYNIDLNIPAKAKGIMETYNLMCFCIVDEEVEVARFLFDGDKYFQDFSFSALERETGDSSYKKIINLMSKMSR